MGHGNNIDGVDDANPGQGGGGPNADKDGVDEDEGAVGNQDDSEPGAQPSQDADAGSDAVSDDTGSDKAKSNKGHGNNADGVDDANPGQGGGGPNADKDGVDEDEGAVGNQDDSKPGAQPSQDADAGSDAASDDTGSDKAKSNKGHGNNIDGVDDANPGQGGGGPNADKDGVDEDEGAVGNQGRFRSGCSAKPGRDRP